MYRARLFLDALLSAIFMVCSLIMFADGRDFSSYLCFVFFVLMVVFTNIDYRRMKERDKHYKP